MLQVPYIVACFSLRKFTTSPLSSRIHQTTAATVASTMFRAGVVRSSARRLALAQNGRNMSSIVKGGGSPLPVSFLHNWYSA